MGYSFYILSKEKEIQKDNFEQIMGRLSDFNRIGINGHPPCDLILKNHYINISGSFTSSGKYVEGFVLNIVMVLLDLGYRPIVISRDWGYGTDEDWEWLDQH